MTLKAMTLETFREYVESWWSENTARQVSNKNSHGALLDLFEWYFRLSTDEQALAGFILAEWLSSPDSSKRFDGLAAIEHFAIRSALPQLRAAELELVSTDTPESRFELSKVRRAIRNLSASGSGQYDRQP